MKKLTIILFLTVAVSSLAVAQEYKKFRVGVGTGYAVAGGSGSKAGVLFYVEPSYRLMDNLALGMRFEWALIARGSSGSTVVNDNTTYDISALGSYTLNTQYYFGTSAFRPFIGVGAGVYTLAATKLDQNGNNTTADNSVAAESKFGFYPRVGFDIKHFTVGFEYNVLSNTNADFKDPNTNVTTTTEFKNSYFGIKIGGFFGGGHK